MDISEVLTIDVDDDEWLEVVNGYKKPTDFISLEGILDYVAMRADDDYAVQETDDVDEIMSVDFDAKDCLGMTAKELINDYIFVPSLQTYFEDMNEAYCAEENLCIDCRYELEADEYKQLHCPNGH